MATDRSAFAQLAVIYRFCAQSMTYPSADWFSDQYLTTLYQFLQQMGGGQYVAELQEAMKSATASLEDLQVEYTRLFINGVPHVIAPPYGRVYKDHSLQGNFAEKTMQFYLQNGFTLKDGADLPDHIVHQLECLSFLAEDGNQAAEEEFLRTLFLPWFPIFASRVKKDAAHPFYPVIVSIIDFFTKEEEEYGV